MRESVYSLTKAFREEIVEYIEGKHQAKVLVFTELFLYGVRGFSHKVDAKHLWAVTTRHPHPVVPHYLREEDREIISRLEVLFPFFRNRKLWEKYLRDYEELPETKRLFSFKEGIAILQKPSLFYHSRIGLYSEILGESVSKRKSKRKFASFEKELYYERKNGEIVQRYAFTIPKHLQMELSGLERYRQKVKVTSEKEFLEEVAKEMTIVSGEDWVERARKFALKTMSSEKDFSFHEIHHIPGGLGAGKSTFITMATYYLTKMKKAKVGIIETTVDNVLKRVKELRKFNIKAVPIIGYSTQAAHLENQLKSLQSQIEDLADWDQEDYELLSYLSGRCIIHSLSKDYEDNPNDVYPCQHILENGEPRLCPLYQQCGVHNQTSDLHDAEVWVATSHSALKSRIPKMADPYNRVYFEAMYDLLDVIFIDEADKVQQDFDEAFFTEYDLFGDKRSLYNELERIGQHLSFHHMENNEAYTWKRNLLKLSQLILSIYNLLSHSSSLKTFLSNKIFHTYFLFVNIFKKIDSQENAQFYQELRTYIDEPMKVQKLLSLVDELLRSESFAETDKIMSDFLQKNVKEHCDDDQVKRQIEFLLYLVQIDYYIKYLIQHFSSMKEYLGIEADLGEFLRFHQKDILPFVPETLTGMMIGYRYLQQENKFKYMEYSGIGRQLLYGWNHLYKRLDRLEGPRCYLSFWH